MAKYEVLSKVKHRDLHFTPAKNFSFYARESISLVGLAEAPLIAKWMPMIFIKLDKGEMFLGGLHSLVPNDNKFIGKNGRWLIPYIPAVVRSYPFKLASMKNTEDNTTKQILAFDNESGLFSTNKRKNSVAIFTSEGHATEFIFKLGGQLEALKKEMDKASKLAQQIERKGLLSPLSIEDKSGKKQLLKNIFSLNEKNLEACTADTLKELSESSALELVFQQKFSLSNFQSLLKKTDDSIISTREDVVERTKEKKAAEINDLVQNLLIGNDD